MAYQTSTNMTYGLYAAVPSRAVDGITSTHMRTDSCTHTEEEDNPAWWVNLGQPYMIDRVVIFNRRDCCVERVNPFNIHIGDSKEVIRNPKCGGHHWIEENKPSVSIPCQGMRGQYVGVRLPGSKRILSLCEVQVFSAGETLVISDANYGRTSTSHACPCISNCVTNCSAANSLSIVTDSCQGLQQCAVNASNDVFGDPCTLTLKYLETTYHCAPGCTYPLGMESGAIPDDSITASSTWDVAHEPYRGRLNGVAGVGAWSARTNTIGEWLQVDLGEMKTVTGTIIQGRYHGDDHWVTSYKLQYSEDGLSWTAYASSNGSEEVFPGNTDRNTPVTNLLDSPTDARYVRFLPQSWHRHISMRVEVLGCSDNAAKSDRCQDGYHLLTRNCVRLHFRTLSHKDAREACEREGARLAMPKTEELDIALRKLVRTVGQNMDFWIGLFDKENFCRRERRWEWVDGSTLGNYKGWNPGEPSNCRSFIMTKLCVQYWSGRTGYPMWDDDHCSRSHSFICQTHPI
ncbi:hypothetical protein Bbelb_200570 [Branchiostoma belcheri]|nr:hypothetical protein Bbelb_200570 [Branchiostoma belcheri]